MNGRLHGPFMWEVWELCNLDRHSCGGCGGSVRHGSSTCHACEEYYRDEDAARAEVRGCTVCGLALTECTGHGIDEL